MDLLVTARTSKAPGEYYRELNAVFGPPYYTRVDALATTEYNARPETLSPEASKESSFREWIVAKLSHASGHARIDALHYMQWRVRGQSWGPRRSTSFAESFKDEGYLNAIVRDAPQAW
jgi:phosphoglucomutase